MADIEIGEREYRSGSWGSVVGYDFGKHDISVNANSYLVHLREPDIDVWVSKDTEESKVIASLLKEKNSADQLYAFMWRLVCNQDPHMVLAKVKLALIKVEDKGYRRAKDEFRQWLRT